MPENTFDIVSKIDLAEVNNAVQQALKEIHQRFDLKDSKSDIQLNEKDNKLLLASLDEFKLKAVTDVLQQKLVKRNVPLKGLTFGPITPPPDPAFVRISRCSKASPSKRRATSLRPSRTARRKCRRPSRAILCGFPAKTAIRCRK